jgi:pectate lyase
MKSYCNLVVIIFILSGIFVCVSEDALALPAFPGAQGFGAVSVGGRGGEVYKVTTLSGGKEEGSLRWALFQPGPKIITFDVSGVIDISTTNGGGNTFDFSYTTIAGQTAPGAGVTIKGQLLSVYSVATLPDDQRVIMSDLIMRFIRVRYEGELDNQADGLRLNNVHNSIVDHVDVSWAADELLTMIGSRNNTVQWSAMVEGDTGGRDSAHNYGFLSGKHCSEITMHHNLFAHNTRRNPYNGVNMFEHINNVCYNFEAGFHFYPTSGNYDNPGDQYDTNTIGNYFKDGVDYDRLRLISNQWVIPAYDYCKHGDWYQSGNYFDWIAEHYNDPAKGYVDLFNNDLPRPYKKTIYSDEDSSVGTTKRFIPFIVNHSYSVATETALDAYDSVLEKSGCLPHDWVMQRIINEVRAGTGSMGRVNPPGNDLMYGLTPGTAPQDSDNDGMPDNWETSHGLNPNNTSDKNDIVPAGESENNRHTGYTYIEYYINELADNLHEVVTKPLVIPSPPQALRIIETP